MLRTRNKKIIALLLVIIVLAVSIPTGLFIFMQSNNKTNSPIMQEKSSLSEVLTSEESALHSEIEDGLYGDVKKEVNLSVEVDAKSSSFTEVLYDLENYPAFLLIQYIDNGYLILDRVSQVIIERVDQGESPYSNYINHKKYYAGINAYFYYNNDEIVNIENSISLSRDEIEYGANQINEMLTKNMNDAITEAEDSRVITMKKDDSGESSATKKDRWGRNDRYMANKEYFENLSSGSRYVNEEFCYVSQDMGFEWNIKSSCGIVALEIIMQYYPRNRVAKTIPKSFVDTLNVKGRTRSIAPLDIGGDPDYPFNPGNSDYLTNHLHHYLDSITYDAALGENYVLDLQNGLDSFYANYPTGAGESRIYAKPYYPGHTQMMNSIKSNNPAILQAGIWGNGYYQVDGAWKKTSIKTHQMVVYGYCTNDKNTSVYDFIVHGGWNSKNNKMYVHKNNTIASLVFSQSAF